MGLILFQRGSIPGRSHLGEALRLREGWSSSLIALDFHVDDFAHICLRVAHGVTGAITDAVGPDRMTYEQLVRAVREVLRRRTPIVHAPPAAVAALSHALGVVVRDVVLTADEIRGLTAGLLVSQQPALGRVSFLEWLQENVSTLGRKYANELDRHFRVA